MSPSAYWLSSYLGELFTIDKESERATVTDHLQKVGHLTLTNGVRIGPVYQCHILFDGVLENGIGAIGRDQEEIATKPIGTYATGNTIDDVMFAGANTCVASTSNSVSSKD